MTRTRRNVLVGLAAGFGSYVFAVGGDTWGQGTVWQDLASTSVWPWLVIVGMISVTAPMLLDAVVRAALAMLVMVCGYYLGDGFDLAEGNWAALVGWGAVAVTIVPLVAAAAYAIKRAVLLTLGRPVPPRRR